MRCICMRAFYLVMDGVYWYRRASLWRWLEDGGEYDYFVCRGEGGVGASCVA